MHGGSVRLGGPARAGSAWCGGAIVELVVPDGAADGCRCRFGSVQELSVWMRNEDSGASAS